MENGISGSFSVKSGGCILSPILFLMVIDWIQRNTTHDKMRGIQWTMFSHLEDLDFVDDLAEVSGNIIHLQENTDKLNSFAKQTGLNINAKKTKVMTINAPEPVTLNGEALEEVEDFTYLGSIPSKDNGTGKDIKSRLSKTQIAFAQLQPIWKSNNYSLRTKLQLYNSNVKSVPLYGSECWRVVDSDMRRVEAFHNNCLRKINRIFWPNKISNRDLHKKSKSTSITTEIKQRRMRWLGLVMRTPQGRIPKITLHWTPSGKRKRGKPRTTWRRTRTSELEEMGYSWGQVQYVAKDRRWIQLVEALCPIGGKGDK
ncbi:uncharacterized protein LOC134244449 [Saccostrea cucullata]|uniref:uncharacterized protein LOC134244449 n=1 Tax=Saccostrea cuccullata TaxID=36930 RepID=UPI002ED5C8C2